MTSPLTGSPSGDLNVNYNGTKKEMFSLAFKTGMLTIVTFGIYRFWQKTRLRRYIWSRANVGGDTFEYTGTGLEKLLGFLVAIVFLAVYLGIIQMVLFFFGMNIMVDPENASPAQVIGQILAIYISFFAVLPFLLFAVYRARRYKLARTRWRGIRFAMEKGAWGYVWRAIGHGLLTLVTLGIMLPRQTYYLEKYMTDRTWFGDARFEQQGRWTALYGKMKHVFIGLALLIASGVGFALSADGFSGLTLLAIVAIPVGVVWFGIGLISYNVQSFAYLAQNKTLGERIAFHAEPRTKDIILAYIVGSIVLAIGASRVDGIPAIVYAAEIVRRFTVDKYIQMAAYETSDAEAVLDGDIGEFVEAYLASTVGDAQPIM